MGQQYAELWCKTIDLANASGADAIYELDGCWAHVCGEFEVAMNGHKTEVGHKGVTVPPYHVCVLRGEMLLGIMGPHDGIVLGGRSGSAEDAILTAIDTEIGRLKEASQ